jgi:hypothetical protein
LPCNSSATLEILECLGDIDSARAFAPEIIGD